LDLSREGLSGTIPTWFGRLILLESLSFWDNQLIGPIPSELGYLIKLTQLDLSDNSLNGTIPLSLENLSMLNDVYFYGNPQLFGAIPASLCSLPDLDGSIEIDCDNIACLSFCCTNSTNDTC
jgi:hypothetical protein